MDVDVPSDPLRSIIASMEALEAPRIATVFRVGFASLGADMLADEDSVKQSVETMDLLFPGADKDHAHHEKPHS